MSERHLLRLTRTNRGHALKWLQRAPDGWFLEVREPSRSLEQNNAIHGLIDQILKQRPVHGGMRMDKAAYKGVFMHALGHEPKMVLTLEGDGYFPMGLSTSALTVGECNQLIESILAWCAREGLTVKHFDTPEPEAPATLGKGGEMASQSKPSASPQERRHELSTSMEKT